MKYKLVNNTEYELKGVYFAGMHHKYYDMFNIAPESTAMIFGDIEEARKYQKILKNNFGYEHFEIETVKEIIKD